MQVFKLALIEHALLVPSNVRLGGISISEITAGLTHILILSHDDACRCHRLIADCPSLSEALSFVLILVAVFLFPVVCLVVAVPQLWHVIHLPYALLYLLADSHYN